VGQHHGHEPHQQVRARFASSRCPPIPTGNVAAYTNSLILSQRLVPSSTCQSRDAAALPISATTCGLRVIGYYRSGWITDDALTVA
jgi:hypothetical protein